MTKRYTAADFANARFAEHPDGGIAMRSEPGDFDEWDTNVEGWHSDDSMAHYGWVPVIPARTIHDSDVEALCTDTASYERDDYLDGFIQGFQQAGGVILEDPEPTNTERLTEMYKDWSCLASPESETFPEYLDRHGVTAPNVKGN